MAKQVTIRISAEDNFSPVMNKYNQATGTAANNTKNLENNSKSSQGAIGGLNNVLKVAAGAFAAIKAAEFVTDIVNLGREANKTERVFGELTSGIGGYQSVLEGLRGATGGIVDDMTLMQGANTLLQMHLATTGDEVATLTEMAVKLGSAMGMDATKAVNDFALMLSNMSVARLDQFGISSSRVRAEVERLLKTGQAANREEAWLSAIMKEGTGALKNLGDAANAGEDAIGRLETKWANFSQNFAQDAARITNEAITTGEQLWEIGQVLTGNHPIQQQQREEAQAAAKAFIDEYQAYFAEYSAMSGLIPADTMEDFGGETGRALMDAMYQAMAAGGDPGQALFKNFGVQPDSPVGRGIIDSFRATYEQAGAAAENAAANAVGEAQAAALEAQAAEEAAWREHWQTMIGDVRQFTDGVGTAFDTIGGKLAAFGQVEMAVRGMQAGIEQAMGTAFQFQPGMNTTGMLDAMTGGKIEGWQLDMPEFMKPEQAEALRAQFEQAAGEVERLQGLVGQGLIKDADLEKAIGLRDNLGLMADEAEAAAAAFESMRLSDVLGTGGGGMRGELTDKLMAGLQESGMTEDQMVALQEKLDMQSGRITGASQALDQQILPFIQKIAATQGPEAAAQAMENLARSMEQSQLMGLTPEQMAANMQMMTGFTSGGTAMGGWSPEMAANMAANGGPMGFLQMMMGGLMGGGQPGAAGGAPGGGGGLFGFLGGAIGALGGTTGPGGEGEGGPGGILGLLKFLTGGGGEEGANLEKMGTDMGAVNETLAEVDETANGTVEKFTVMAEQLGTGLENVTGMQDVLNEIEGVYEVTVKLNLVPNDPMLAALLGMGGGLMQEVRDNGGSVPGKNPRVAER